EPWPDRFRRASLGEKTRPFDRRSAGRVAFFCPATWGGRPSEANPSTSTTRWGEASRTPVQGSRATRGGPGEERDRTYRSVGPIHVPTCGAVGGCFCPGRPKTRVPPTATRRPAAPG